MKKANEKPEIGIVLCTYNGEHYILEQLDSLVQNTRRPDWIHIYDDGSTDQTVAVVKEYGVSHGEVCLHQNETNKGYAMNFLEALRENESSYMMLCDQDDIWHADKIEKTLEQMKQLEREYGEEVPLMVFTDAMNYDSETGVEQGSFHKNSHLNTKRIDTPHLFMENKCIGCTIMVNAAVRQYLKRLPGQIRVHDWWLALICSHFGKIVYLDETTLQYRQHSGNMIGGSSFQDYVKKCMGSLRSQRRAIRDTFAQGSAFYEVFGGDLTGRDREIAAQFASMSQRGWFGRRWNMLRFGFCKSGFVRNVALFFLI